MKEFTLMLFGMLFLVMFVLFVMNTMALKKHIDREKLQNRPDFDKIISGPIPPVEVLTEVGRKKYRTCKILLVTSIIGIAVFLILKEM